VQPLRSGQLRLADLNAAPFDSNGCRNVVLNFVFAVFRAGIAFNGESFCH
jgi:hypothetical protein